MQSTTDIAAKWQQLYSSGLDLGSPTGPEADAGFGGRYQHYQHGRIYWHPQVGTHEVHGGILDEYLRIGGTGRHPAWGIRALAFPTSDEHRTVDDFAQVSEFETGAIYWGYGAAGVPIYSPFYPAWRGLKINLGYPLTESLPGPSGSQVVFCQFGCLFTGGPKNDVHPLYYKGPHSGRPQIVTTDQISIDGAFTTLVLPGDIWQLIQKFNKNYFSDLWKGHLVLQAVNAARNQVPVVVEIGNLRPHDSDVVIDFRIRLAPGTKLADRTLYDLAIKRGGGGSTTTTIATAVVSASPAVIAKTAVGTTLLGTTTTADTGHAIVMVPHCVYAKADWTRFGAMHATDIHASERADVYHRKLAELGRTESLQNYNNYNESFRDTIHYANKLHDLGILDFLIITGDLVDYQFEEWQDPTRGWGNFLYFEHILRGTVGSPIGRAVEELRVPIFTTLGNHDYRQKAYKLLFDGDVPLFPPTFRNYLPHNLTEDDANALQGGHPTVSSDTALDMVRLIRKPEFYGQRMNEIGLGIGTNSYIVPLGPNRLVILDSAYDLGVTEGVWDAFKVGFLGIGDEDRKSFAAGSPNQVGVIDDHLSLVEQALHEAGDGVVIVGIHGPPLNLKSSEFEDYFRETEHSSADIKDIVGHLIRASPSDFGITWNPDTPGNVLITGDGIAAIRWDACINIARGRHAGWMNSAGQPFFMHGTVDDLLDDSVSKGRANDLLKMCAGASVPGHSVTRGTDLVLCGHGHNKVDYRVHWTGSELQFFMDFYTETPHSYYGTRKASWDNGNTNIGVVIQSGAAPNPQPNNNIKDHRWDGEEWTITVPPYRDPLNSSGNRTAWWSQHRPLILQTGAVGPMEEASNSRHASGKPKPNPTFQGFRVFTVALNTINAIYYVSMEDLRSLQFTMPWEKFEGGFIRLTSVFKPDQSINVESGSPVAGAIQPGWMSAHWQLEPVAANVCWIRNRWKSDQCLNIESGSLTFGPIQAGWLSARWAIEPIPGSDHFRIRSYWKPDQCLHIETGKLQAGPIQPGWLSAQWTIATA